MTTFNPWYGVSNGGGLPVQLLTNCNSGIPILAARSAIDDDTWGNWYKLITAANIGEQNVSSASHANTANNANTATQATQDSAGNNINATYIKGLSVSGKVITYTKGDGTTGTLTTQDTNTTYTAGTGLQLSGMTFTLVGASSTTLGGIKLGYTDNTNARLYAVKADGMGNAYVSVPWTDTDTHWYSYLYAGSSSGIGNAITENGETYIQLKENGSLRSQLNIVGSGTTKVTSNAEGKITIHTPDYSLPAATSTVLGGIKTGYTEQANYRALYLDSSDKAYVYIPSGNTSTTGLMTSTYAGYIYNAMRVNASALYANATSGNGSSYQGYYDFLSPAGKRLKLVWGFTAASSGKMTVSFRSSFPTACIGVWMSLYNTNTDNSIPGYKITARSTTSFTAYCMYRQLNGQGWESQPWFWLAIGY